MSVLLKRLFLATALVATPALGASDAETEDTPKEPVSVETAETGDDDAPEKAKADDGATEATTASGEEWANKLRKRHHEGDVALGVCGARLSALMWFYQSSVADGRDDLQPAYEAVKESRTVLKDEAERRAIEDGVPTSVSVMNDHSTELWEKLVDASENPETFQEAHDELYTNVQECLSIFFNRGVKSEPAENEAAEDDAAKGDAAKTDAEKAEDDATKAAD